MLSLDCTILFSIPIRSLWILLYTIPFLFQYAVFEYLYALQLLNQLNYRDISLLLYHLKKSLSLYIGCSNFAFIFFTPLFYGFVSLTWCFMFSLCNISSFNFPHIFIWFFVPFSSAIPDGFRFCMGHDYFLFFLKVLSNICLVVSLFWWFLFVSRTEISVFVFFCKCFFLETGKLEAWDKFHTYMMISDLFGKFFLLFFPTSHMYLRKRTW
jgi:hypothetical protein